MDDKKLNFNDDILPEGPDNEPSFESMDNIVGVNTNAIQPQPVVEPLDFEVGETGGCNPVVEKKKKKKRDWFKGFLLILVSISLGMNGFMYFQINNLEFGEISSVPVNSVNFDITTNLTDIVEEASESVIAIAVYKNGQMSGSGSGVVYEYSNNVAYMITNHHVIDGASEIQVIFPDQTSVSAILIGSDQYSDIAVLQAQVDFVPSVATIGNSDLLKSGEPVLAIGSPLGIEYAGSVTQGVVSATNRTVSVDLNGDYQDDWDMNVIQTDAAINPGNSGGAFVNSVGELVGITSMKFSDTSVEGMGFALPINDVMDVVQELRESGEIIRPILGVSGVYLGNLSFFEMSYYRIDTDLNYGVYVAGVVEGTGASEVKIEAGDIITHINGIKITDYKTFITELYDHKPGDTVNLIVNRAGVDYEVPVKLS